MEEQPMSGMFSLNGNRLTMHRPGQSFRVKVKLQHVTIGETTSRGLHFAVQQDDTIPMGAQISASPGGSLDLKVDVNCTGELLPGSEFYVDLVPRETFEEQPIHSSWTHFMKRMGFSIDPGPLPFSTIRSRKWANYTWVGELIEIHGEHGCGMISIPARVTKISPYDGPCPAHLTDRYRDQKLYTIELEAVDDEALKRIGLLQPKPGGV